MNHFRVLFAKMFFRDVRDVFVQFSRRKSAEHIKQSVRLICWLADFEGKSTIKVMLGKVLQI